MSEREDQRHVFYAKEPVRAPELSSADMSIVKGARGDLLAMFMFLRSSSFSAT